VHRVAHLTENSTYQRHRPVSRQMLPKTAGNMPGIAFQGDFLLRCSRGRNCGRHFPGMRPNLQMKAIHWQAHKVISENRIFGFWCLTGIQGYVIVKSRLTMKRIFSMDLKQTAKIFKALGHPTRIKIVQHLIAIDTCICGEIVGIFPYSQSTISQHLKILKESGIVCGEVEGPKTYFCVDKTVLEQFKQYVKTL
jgi:DNA-binding transcriptional ArsR family regulator